MLLLQPSPETGERRESILMFYYDDDDLFSMFFILPYLQGVQGNRMLVLPASTLSTQQS